MIEGFVKESAIGSEHPIAEQVKEKFGGLRFYMSSETDEMTKLIDEAEKECNNTCETCGEPATCTMRGWVKRVCKKCAEKNGREYIEDSNVVCEQQ